MLQKRGWLIYYNKVRLQYRSLLTVSEIDVCCFVSAGWFTDEVINKTIYRLGKSQQEKYHWFASPHILKLLPSLLTLSITQCSLRILQSNVKSKVVFFIQEPHYYTMTKAQAYASAKTTPWTKAGHLDHFLLKHCWNFFSQYFLGSSNYLLLQPLLQAVSPITLLLDAASLSARLLTSIKWNIASLDQQLCCFSGFFSFKY